MRVLFFDVFGTSVEQRTPVADALWEAVRKALWADGSSMNGGIRAKVQKMVCLTRSFVDTKSELKVSYSRTTSGSNLVVYVLSATISQYSQV